MFVEQESYRESNSPNGSVKSSTVLKLSLLEFLKKVVFTPKITPSLVKNKSESSNWSKNLLVEQENYREPNAGNCNVGSSAILELCLFKSDKKAFFNPKMTLSLIKTKRIRYLILKLGR